MLSKQAEMSMLNGDFEHFDEAGAELVAGKEVGDFEFAAFVCRRSFHDTCMYSVVSVLK